MRQLLFALRLIWILMTALVTVIVLLRDMRDLVPAGLLTAAEGLPFGPEVLAWPEGKIAPLVFVALLVISDVILVVTGMSTGPQLSEVKSRPASLKKARLLEKLGEHRQAADTYAELGHEEKGAKLLVSHGHSIEAARMLLDKGLPKKAEKLLRGIEARDAGMAAELLVKYERHDVARDLFRRAGAYHAQRREIGRAGKCYYRAGDLEAAKDYLVECWEEIVRPDQPAEVADMLLEVGAAREAGLAYSRAAMASDDIEVQRSYSRKAAAILAKAGEHATGAELLERSGQISDAAELYAHAGNIDKAISLLRSIKAGERAAQILLKVGDNDGAIDLLVEAGQVRQAAELALKAGEVRRGAMLLERVGDVDGAAKLLEQAGELIEAAELVRNAGNVMYAAALYEKAGAHARAAAIYEAAGEELRAAALYAKQGEGVPAARLFMKSGRMREASDALGGLVSEESRPLHAELGVRFVELGESGQALEHFMAAIANAPINAQNAGVYYHLAMLYETLGDNPTALSLYLQVYNVNPRIKDLLPRLQRAQEQANEEKQAAATGGAPQGGGAESDPRYSATVGIAAIQTDTGLSKVQTPKDRYKVVGELGRGAMGRVLKAVDQLLQRGVALKVLPEGLASHPGARTAFVAEARAAAALHHPNIVTLYDVGTENNVPYIAMELVEGSDLATFVSQPPGVGLHERLRLVTEICDALEAAHKRGIVHRDVKPSNVLVDQERHVRLVDFGIARAKGSVEESGAMVGTPFYMSPEQARAGAVDRRSDIYSLGVVLFELCVGQRPFEQGDVIQHHISTPPPSMRAINPNMPSKLDTLVSACLSKDPARRPTSAVQVRDVLTSIMAELARPQAR